VTEQVLVLPRRAVPGGLGFTGIRATSTAELEALRAVIVQKGAWMDRPIAEIDPTHKQVIPYVVVRDRGGVAERVFLMERTDAGGDARLHRRATIGVGGHINPIDAEDPLSAGLVREWQEELVADWRPDFVPIGLLNDDRNAVGAVHLGVVFAVEAAGRRIDVRERDKLSGQMVSVSEVHAARDRLETWSQLLADSLWPMDQSP
jgi:predicted NUDIX family phosphoesterase